ncbi:hypothetical protein [Ruegeria sp. Ofav3-42]|nr:hypothetical protein [Ruegeria sp. Ofav3-42]MCG7522319.1 hypothetical protein [Ruegeria sp. Ofav3-42]
MEEKRKTIDYASFTILLSLRKKIDGQRKNNRRRTVGSNVIKSVEVTQLH